MQAALRDMIREIVREELKAIPDDKPTAEYVSTAEAAEIAGVTPGTIRRWKDEGKLTPAGAGRELRFLRTEVLARMERANRANARARPNSPRQSPEDIGNDIVRRIASL